MAIAQVIQIEFEEGDKDEIMWPWHFTRDGFLVHRGEGYEESEDGVISTEKG